MNILIPDSWLREYLTTKATPDQIKNFLSLCGPSVERIHKAGKEVVYDIEITGNRPDAMSVAGIAREAAAILPRFGIQAKFVNDPYAIRTKTFSGDKKLVIKTDARLNPRWASVVLTHIHVGPSPSWLTKRLEETGIRSLNNVVDISNYLMRAFGQPVHIFDYDEIKEHSMTLRASRKGEKLVTLDGKTHVLPGGDIVIEDGAGRLIDLCGIMGGYNSSVKTTTTTVVLFTQTYNPVHIRKTSMALAHRTEAASLFEKGVDSELVLPTLIRGAELLGELAGGKPASRLYDIYPRPFRPYTVTCTKEKLSSYTGVNFSDGEVRKILTPLGFGVKKNLHVTVPSWRRDVAIDVDIIEEIARIYGYQNIKSELPATPPPVTVPNQLLRWETEVKTRLRDWGFTEFYTYSMISKKLARDFDADLTKTYKIVNPLSEEWVYMRPHLFPSTLASFAENLRHSDNLRVFELSMAYQWQPNELPLEKPTLIVLWSGDKFLEAKGLAEAIFALFGIDFEKAVSEKTPHQHHWYTEKGLTIDSYGSLGVLNSDTLSKVNIATPVTRLYLDFAKLVEDANPVKKYVPIPKYPPVIEDFSFLVPPDFRVGPMIDVLSKVHKLIHSVRLLDAYENKRTFRVEYLDPTKTLTSLDIAPVHQKILEYAAEKFGVSPVI